jgi:mono/diheme cytochrome c family protein
VNLHEVIAQGEHEGMPAWGGDLSTNEIDALAGFILSPDGSALFFENCSQCHQVSDLISIDPLVLKSALDQGANYPPHLDQDVPDWSQQFDAEERTTLLNFLVAPDGQRLFVLNCSSCHGSAVAFSGEEDELRSIIREGGLHLEMPPWRDTLSDQDLELLADYVVDPIGEDAGGSLFSQYCVSCHGTRIPSSEDVESALEIISSGGAHESMPIWGEALTPEQLDALVDYTLETSRGTPIQLGQQLYAQNCAVCHGDFGEGGLNPARPDDIIAPISSAEYLQTRDDSVLKSIIAQGQPNFGMSPFGTSFGGPLDDSEIDAIVAFLRNWESNPPVELPPEIPAGPIATSGAEIFSSVCAECHGADGEGDIGPALNTTEYQSGVTDGELFETISLGHEASVMVPWGEILTSDQIQQLVAHIRTLDTASLGPTPEGVSYSRDIVPIFEAKCAGCHGALGGWDASSYGSVINSGDNGPAVIPGDVEGSLLAQKLLGTHTFGTIMPPGGSLPEDEIQIILEWIDIGAPNN